MIIKKTETGISIDGEGCLLIHRENNGTYINIQGPETGSTWEIELKNFNFSRMIDRSFRGKIRTLWSAAYFIFKERLPEPVQRINKDHWTGIQKI